MTNREKFHASYISNNNWFVYLHGFVAIIYCLQQAGHVFEREMVQV